MFILIHSPCFIQWQACRKVYIICYTREDYHKLQRRDFLKKMCHAVSSKVRVQILVVKIVRKMPVFMLKHCLQQCQLYFHLQCFIASWHSSYRINCHEVLRVFLVSFPPSFPPSTLPCHSSFQQSPIPVGLGAALMMCILSDVHFGTENCYSCLPVCRCLLFTHFCYQ